MRRREIEGADGSEESGVKLRIAERTKPTSASGSQMAGRDGERTSGRLGVRGKEAEGGGNGEEVGADEVGESRRESAGLATVPCSGRDVR